MSIFRSLTNTIRTIGAVGADVATGGMFAVTGKTLTERSLQRQSEEERAEQEQEAAEILIRLLRELKK